jgi:hypothetical protein
LEAYGNRLSPDGIESFEKELTGILHAHTDAEAYQVLEGATTILAAAAQSQPEAVAGLVQKWIAVSNPLGILPTTVLRPLVLATSAPAVWDLLSSAASPGRDPWVLAWLKLLPSANWDDEHAQLAIELLQRSATSEFGGSRGLLDSICTVDPEGAIVLLDGLIDRIASEPGLAKALSIEFYDPLLLQSPLGTVLLGNPRKFGDLYLALDAVERHMDSHATALGALLTVDPTFGTRWLDEAIQRIRRPTYDDNRDYTALWRRDDWLTVLGPLCRRILEDPRDTPVDESLLIPLLRIPGGSKEQAEVVARQHVLLVELIMESRDDSRKCTRLFQAIAHVPEEERRRLIGVYLNVTPPLETFTSLSFEPIVWGWSGSEVPILERHRAFMESLLPLCDRAELLPHRASIEGQIRSIDGAIVRAKRQDFIAER